MGFSICSSFGRQLCQNCGWEGSELYVPSHITEPPCSILNSVFKRSFWYSYQLTNHFRPFWSVFFAKFYCVWYFSAFWSCILIRSKKKFWIFWKFFMWLVEKNLWNQYIETIQTSHIFLSLGLPEKYPKIKNLKTTKASTIDFYFSGEKQGWLFSRRYSVMTHCTNILN